MVTNPFYCGCTVTMGILPAVLLLKLAINIDGIKTSAFYNSAAQLVNDYESPYLYFIDKDSFSIVLKSAFQCFHFLPVYVFSPSQCLGVL